MVTIGPCVHVLAKEDWKSEFLACSGGTVDGRICWPGGRLGWGSRERKCYFGEAFNTVRPMHTHLCLGLWPGPPAVSLVLGLLSFNPFSPHSSCQWSLNKCVLYMVSLFAYLFMVNIFHNYANCMREETLFVLFTTLYPTIGTHT